MNVSSFIGLLPAAMIALATFIGFIFFARCALGYRRSIERRLATHRSVPYRTAETSPEDVLAFLEDIGKMALCGMTAIGTLAVGMFATWFAWRGTFIERHVAATNARLVGVHAENRRINEQVQRQEEDIAALLQDLAARHSERRLSSPIRQKDKTCEVHVRITDQGGRWLDAIKIGSIGTTEKMAPAHQSNFRIEANRGRVPTLKTPESGSLVIRAIDNRGYDIPIEHIEEVALDCDGRRVLLVEYGKVSKGRLIDLTSAATKTAIAYPLPPSAAWPRGFVVSRP